MPREVVIGNGIALATFDACASLRELYFPYVGLMNQTMGRAGELGIACQGSVSWLRSPSWFRRAELGEDGRRARFEFRNDELDLTLSLSLSWKEGARVLEREFTLATRQSSPRAFRLLAHHDFCLGESDLGNEVRAFPGTNHLEHGKGADRVRLELDGSSGPGLSDWTLGRRDDYEGRGVRAAAEKSELGRNPCAVGAGESIIAYDFELDAGREARILLTMSIESPRPEASFPESTPTSSRRPIEPDGDLDEELLLLEARSAGLLASHQDRDGAVIAAADAWNLELAWEHYAYCWPRDGAFVARAMDECGRRDLAARFFNFAAATVDEGGFFYQRYRPDGHRASSWHAEPESHEQHLPIQSDETALVLWALGRHLEGGSDEDLERRWPFLKTMADFLLIYRDPDTGLPRPSHDLWEERFGIHTFGIAAKEAALTTASALATRFDRDQEMRRDAERWRVASDELRGARRRYLFHEDAGRYARRAVLDGGGYHLDMTPDASLAGLFLFDDKREYPEEIVATLTAVAEATRVSGEIGGHARYVDDQYERAPGDPEGPGNPWVICSLWMAEWQMERAATPEELSKTHEVFDWVLKRQSPSGALAEQFDPRTGEPRSVMPLTWSHAALISALARYRCRRKVLKPKKS